MNTQALEELERLTLSCQYTEGGYPEASMMPMPTGAYVRYADVADQLKAIREPTELEASKTLLKQALKEANAKLAACEALLSSWDEYNAKHLKAVRQPYTLPVREPAAQLRAALRGEA